MEKLKTFLVEKISSTNTKKTLGRRSSVGKLIAFASGEFSADGLLISSEDGKRQKLIGQTKKDLALNGVTQVKIKGEKGVMKDVTFVI